MLPGVDSSFMFDNVPSSKILFNFYIHVLNITSSWFKCNFFEISCSKHFHRKSSFLITSSFKWWQPLGVKCSKSTKICWGRVVNFRSITIGKRNIIIFLPLQYVMFYTIYFFLNNWVYRMYAIRRVKDAFKNNKIIHEPSEILQQLHEARKFLNIIKRQVIFYKLY